MEGQKQEVTTLNKKEIEDFLTLIAERIDASDDAYMHSVLAFNHIMRQPDAEALFDEPMRKVAREVWTKIKSMGIMLGDPPMLFGLPEVNEDSH